MIIASDPNIFLLLSEWGRTRKGFDFLVPSQLKENLSRRKKFQLRGGESPNIKTAKWVNFFIIC